MRFRIEYVSTDKSRLAVLARQLDQGDFALSESPELGGIPVMRFLSQPRITKPDGSMDLSVFRFQLVSGNDLAKLRVGDVVELGP